MSENSKHNSLLFVVCSQEFTMFIYFEIQRTNLPYMTALNFEYELVDSRRFACALGSHCGLQTIFLVSLNFYFISKVKNSVRIRNVEKKNLFGGCI